MGKIKIHTLGSEEEKAQKEKLTRQREEKKKRESAQGKVHLAGQKGGERIKEAGALSEEETEKMAKLTEEVEKDQTEGLDIEDKKSSKPRKVHTRSKKYQSVITKIDPTKYYQIPDALKLLREITLTKFDATVEVHLNTIEKGLRGKVQFPHGTGREIRVKIADDGNIEQIVEAINSGKIDFDVLIAHPSVMAKLARVARILGPKGLMPNPKNGTVSSTPERVAEKMSKGEVQWKTETDFPLIHQVLGKLSFKDQQLQDNFAALVNSIGENKITKITLKSTMSPGIKIHL